MLTGRDSVYLNVQYLYRLEHPVPDVTFQILTKEHPNIQYSGTCLRLTSFNVK